MKRNTPRHGKTRELSTYLNISRCTAVGLLELLWHATAQLAPRGDIGQLSDDHIAEELFWDGDPKALMEALVKARWVDPCKKHRLVVHDWQDHCDQTVKRTKAVEDRGFAVAQFPTSSELVSNSSETSLPGTIAGNHKPLPGTGNREPSAPSGARSLVLERWSEVKEAASMYGREWRGEKPSEARISIMAARAAAEDFADQGVTLVHAVHGYMAFHRIVSGDYDPMSHFTPETIYRASKFEKYVEAYGNAIRSGLSPPFLAASPKPPKTFADHQQDENRKWFMENAYDNESAEPGSNRIGAAVLSLPVGRK